MSRRLLGSSSDRSRRSAGCGRSADAGPSPERESTWAARSPAAWDCRWAAGPVVESAAALAQVRATLTPLARQDEISVGFGAVPEAEAARQAPAPAPAVSPRVVSVAAAASDRQF